MMAKCVLASKDTYFAKLLEQAPSATLTKQTTF